MERRVYIDTIGRETRRVVTEDGKPVELAYAYQGDMGLVGNLYLGRVERVLPGMHAAFVDIGLEKNAFLSLDDLPQAAVSAGVSAPKPVSVHAGQAVLVQVVKEPGGDKGPRVTMNPTIPGTLCVLLPTVAAVGVSRHIQDAARRAALEQIGRAACPAGMGIILRTAAADAADGAIAGEVAELAAQWHDMAGHAQAQRPPVLIWSEGDLAMRAARDMQVEPVFGPLDAALEARLEKDLRRQIWLDSGGYLVIDQAEALCAIDVNSGKYTGKRALSETILRINREAATEVARQIRLRDLGGVIVVDFINMQEETDRLSVLAAFEDALSADRGKYHVHGYTGTGLLELTRRPVWRPVRQAICQDCACCRGEGATLAPQAQAHQQLRHVRALRAQGNTGIITLDIPTRVKDIIAEIGTPEDVVLSAKENCPS